MTQTTTSATSSTTTTTTETTSPTTETLAPALDGVHHLKLPVADLPRSRAWYETRLGYRVVTEFIEQGQLMGLALIHPNGGPMLALRRDPDRAAAAAGFDYFSIGVPDEAGLRALAERLTALGEDHAGVHRGSLGWVLPLLHDPDGHEVRFYTTTSHTDPDPEQVLRAHDARESAERYEREHPQPRPPSV